MSNPNIDINVSRPVQPISTYKTKVLKGNHSFASQVTEPNMKYVIKHDFDLDGEDITIPANCVLEFDGGSLSNGTLVGQNTEINAELVKIFNNNVIFDGIWNASEAYPEWFGAKKSDVNNVIDSTIPIQKCIDTFLVTKLCGAETDYKKVYSISTIYIRPYLRTVSRSLIIDGRINVLKGGYGVWVGNYCSVVGTGRNAVISASNNEEDKPNALVTLGVNDEVNRTTHRTLIKDLYLLGPSKYGIYCKKREGTDSYDKYNAFSQISGISIYACDYGIYGCIRASFIEISTNGTRGNVYLTDESNKNIINITGNASAIPSGDEGIPYEAFLHIEGSFNKITQGVYDVGNAGVQKRLVDFIGSNNSINPNGYTIQPTETTNEQTRYAYNDGTYAILNPSYTVNYVGCQPINDVADNLIRRVLFNKTVSYNINRVQKIAQEDDLHYIEFQFGLVQGFIGIDFIGYSVNYCIERIEVFRNNTDVTPFLTVNNKHTGAITRAFIEDYSKFINGNSLAAANNLTIRCHFTTNETRLIGARLFGCHPGSPSNHVISNDNKPPYYCVRTGDMHIINSATGVYPIFPRVQGIKIRWCNANGFTAAATKGNTASRPVGQHTEGSATVGELTAYDIGFSYFDTQINKVIYAKSINGSTGDVAWIETDGAIAGVSRSGTTRPIGSSIYVGFMFFDTSVGINKPIYASAISGDTVTWVDATGTPV